MSALQSAPNAVSLRQHIFITGGSQGLGLALAQLVASKGADVTVCSRSRDKLQAAVALIRVGMRAVLHDGE